VKSSAKAWKNNYADRSMLDKKTPQVAGLFFLPNLFTLFKRLGKLEHHCVQAQQVNLNSLLTIEFPT